MPNRIIKESICTSDSVDQMTWFEECFWQRLIVNCDDYGRFDARLTVIKSRLFPLKDRMSLKDIECALEKLAKLGCIIFYENNGKPYLYIPTWETYQTVRAKRSKYPAPDERLQSSEIICKQMQSDASGCSRNPIQSESESYSLSESVSESLSKSEADIADKPLNEESFDVFWKEYPRKASKGDALKAFKKLCKNKDAPNIDRLLESINTHKSSIGWQKDNGQFIPYAATYLNKGMYDDELSASVGATNQITSGFFTNIAKELKEK